jgi:hypothetical protein
MLVNVNSLWGRMDFVKKGELLGVVKFKAVFSEFTYTVTYGNFG